MAGLFELVKQDIDAEGPRCPAHAIYAAMVLYASGDATGAQAVSYLEAVAGISFDAATLDDLAGFSSAIDAKNGVQVRDYLHVVHAYNMVVETSTSLTESQWRTRLEIT